MASVVVAPSVLESITKPQWVQIPAVKPFCSSSCGHEVIEPRACADNAVGFACAFARARVCFAFVPFAIGCLVFASPFESCCTVLESECSAV